MSEVPFHYVDLRTFCYETEDEQVVERALRLFLPEAATVERESSQGHLGDRILVLSARVEGADAVRTVLETLRADGVLETVRGDLDARVDEDCSLHLHLDKQAAAEGRAALGDGIALRAKVEAYPATREAAVENAAAALE